MGFVDAIAPVLAVLTAVVSIAVGLSGLLGRASARASARFWLEAAAALQPESTQRRAAETAYLAAMARLTAGARYPVSGTAVAILVAVNSWALVFLPLVRPGQISPTSPALETALVVFGAFGCFGSVLALEVWLRNRQRAQQDFLGFSLVHTEVEVTGGRWRLFQRPAVDTVLVVGSAIFTAIGIRDVIDDIRAAPPGTYDWWDRPVSVGIFLGPGCAFLLAMLIFLRLVRSGVRLRDQAEGCSVRVVLADVPKGSFRRRRRRQARGTRPRGVG